MAESILLVEDDPDVRRLLCEYLPRHGVAVTAVGTCTEGRRALAATRYDLIALDLQLPDGNGLQLAREIHEALGTPIIIVSGRQDEADRVLGLEVAADDYLTKPFSPRELLARIRAVLRRTLGSTRDPGGTSSPANSSGMNADGASVATIEVRRGALARAYRFAGWDLNINTRKFTAPDGRAIPLTISEFNLLVAFLNAPGQVLTRDQLLYASRLHDDVYDRTIDVQILRLRRKIERDPRAPEFIRTERGVGYSFIATVERVQ